MGKFMSRQFISKILFASILLSSATFASTNKSTVSISDPQKTIMVDQISKQFTLTLPSTPSTGFSWLLQSYDPHFVKLIKHNYVAPANEIPGASGVEHWTFEIAMDEIAGPQLTQINFIYARMWDVNHTLSKKADFTVVLY